jgi:hypothetical protein
MCCFAQPVDSVSDTKIFARLLEGGWQYLVYQMSFKSPTANAMVLPLPVQLPATDDQTLEFISLKDYEDFFSDLDQGFPSEYKGFPPPAAEVDSAAAGALTLEVHEVGDFVASFVPSIADFTRLDEQFRIPKESWDQIPGYGNYGFAVFQLKSLAGTPHPMAFKFRSRLGSGGDRQIFFPTVHIHDGEVHQREEFDHTLYLQAPEFDAACGRYNATPQPRPDATTKHVRSKWPAKEFCNIDKSLGIVDAEGLVHRLGMHGQLANTDVLASLSLPAASQGLWYLPAGAGAVAGIAGVVGLKWFFDRRDKVARETNRADKAK